MPHLLILAILATTPAAAQDTTAADAARNVAGLRGTNERRAALLEEFRYRELGPAAFSGRITAIAVPEPYRKTIWIGAASGGVWRTRNGGTTWEPAADAIGALSIGDVAVAPSNADIVWVGTGEKNSLRSNSWGNGVHKTTNGGRTWTRVGFADSKSIGKIVIHPGNPDIVYVAVLGHLWGPHNERGVYKTTDGGATWNRVLFVNDTTGFVDLSMDPSNPDVLYAAAWHRFRRGGGRMQGVGAGSGLYRTTDGGRAWTELTDAALDNGLPDGDRLGRVGIHVHRKTPRIVYAVIQNNRGVQSTGLTPFGGVFRSSDAGRTWRQMNDLSAVPFYFYNEIWPDPNDTNHVFLNAAPLYESRDGGATFEVRRLSRVHVDHHAMWIDPADSEHIVLGNDGGVYITWDGGRTWDHQVIPVAQFYTVSVDTAQSPWLVCGGLQDNGTWCGPSESRDSRGITDWDWYEISGGDGFHVQVPWHDPTTVYSESQFGNMGRRDLRTMERVSIRPLAADAGAESGFVFRWGWNTPMVLSQHDTDVVYVGSNHLIKLLDRGNDWEILGPDMTRANRANPAPDTGYTSYRALFAIAESPRTGQVIWTGSDDGLIWVTRDGGVTWTNTTTNLPAAAPTHCFVSSIAASYHAEARAYVTLDCHRRDDYRPHVYRTDDFGQTWTASATGLDGEWGALSVLESARNPDVVFVGTETGVAISFDRGGQWTKFNSNLPPAGVRMMSQVHRDRVLVVATFGRGIWVNPIGALEELTDSVVEARAHLFDVLDARQFSESDMYWSFGSAPFIADNPPRGAVIRYYLRDSADMDVRLVIKDSTGATVRTLTGRGYPGLHTATWNLQRSDPRPRELGGPTSPNALREVPPGPYTVTLSVHGLTLSETFRVTRGWGENRTGRLR